MLLHSFDNVENGITAIVAKNFAGFFVTIKDIKEDVYLPTGITFKTEDAAIAKAKELAA